VVASGVISADALGRRPPEELTVRITDIALSTPVAGVRPGPARRAGTHDSSPILTSGENRGTSHPDEVAAGALARAASLATAGKVVAASNQQAAHSVKGELLDLTRVP
jgi:hypothetical protein